jgi:hypothetical protein
VMLFALLFSCLVMALGEEPEVLFQSANTAYEQGDFDGARQGFEALVAEGHTTGAVLYNLGNSYLQSGDLGRAVASFRQAELRMPRDKALAQNLRFARSSSKAMVIPVQPHVLVRWFFCWRYRLSEEELHWLFVGSNALFWMFSLGVVFRPQSGAARGALAVAAVPFVWVGLNLLVAVALPSQVGVVLADRTSGYASPRVAETVDFVIREGTECWWSEHREGWVFVALSDGREGWVQSADLALLRL